MKRLYIFLCLSAVLLPTGGAFAQCGSNSSTLTEANGQVNYAYVGMPYTYMLQIEPPSGFYLQSVNFMQWNAFVNGAGFDSQYCSGSCNFPVTWSGECGDRLKVVVAANVTFEYGQATSTETLKCTLSLDLQKMTTVTIEPDANYSVIPCYTQAPLYFDLFSECADTYVLEVYEMDGITPNTAWQVQCENLPTCSRFKVIPDEFTNAIIRAESHVISNYNIYTAATYSVLRGCPVSRLYNVPLSSSVPEHTAVQDYIRVNTGGSGMLSILPGDRKYFKAGDYILLEPGFEVKNGGFFKAKIAPCNSDCYAFMPAVNDVHPPSQELTPVSMPISPPATSTASIQSPPATTDIRIGVYPNPVTDEARIVLSTEPSALLPYTLQDIQGRQVASGKIRAATEVLSMGHLAPGLYLLNIYVGGQPSSFKLVKQ